MRERTKSNRRKRKVKEKLGMRIFSTLPTLSQGGEKEPTEVHCPVVEMPTRCKLSCLSWNKCTKSQISSSDYEGMQLLVRLFFLLNVMEYEEHEKRALSVDFSCSEPAMLVSGSDNCKFLQSTVLLFSLVTCKAVIDLSLSACVTAIQVIVLEYEEHEKRASSVDFSCSEASMLVSGSDDHKVKIWCTRQEASVPSTDMKANICSVSIIPDPVFMWPVRLVPVPEYPLVIEKKIDDDDESAQQSDISSYGEDGSLQDFREVVLEWIECGCFTLYPTRQKGNGPRCHACLKDTVFCGVFDGHGPYGHMVAKRGMDSIPLKLSSQWEVSITSEDVLREISLNAAGSINSEDTAFVSADNFTILEDGCSYQRSCGVG
ncbi:hypothetical protein Q3G72_011857 [Acer saccharum]|nr:hypothetical protein Q3G72_011857 [Acer saccharum]